MVANVGSFLEIVLEFESYLFVYFVDLNFISGEEIWMRMLKMGSVFFYMSLSIWICLVAEKVQW